MKFLPSQLCVGFLNVVFNSVRTLQLYLLALSLETES